MIHELVKPDDLILHERPELFDLKYPQMDAEELGKDLVENMIYYDGMGLAAPQIGIPYKVFSIMVDDNAILCFNPRITMKTPKTTYIKEGCLTFPGLYFSVKRAYGINCTFSAVNGEMQHASFVDLSARAFQHEYDHMLGKLFTEYAGNFQLRNAKRKQKLWLRKQRKNGKKLD
jgi:peptide deformylase